MGGVAGVCLQVSCFVSCSLTAALLAVCLPLGSGAVCNYLESCQLCRLQRPKVNIIGPITKLITFSVATVCGASLAGPPIHEGRAWAPTVCLSTSAPRPASPPKRHCQQQTSFSGEKYCGVASNLAHLGRMRLSPGRMQRSCKSPSTLGAATRTSGKV